MGRRSSLQLRFHNDPTPNKCFRIKNNEYNLPMYIPGVGV